MRRVSAAASAARYGYVVLYLHGVHLNRLHDKPAFIEQFDRHGLAVVAPQTQAELVDRQDLPRVRSARSPPSGTCWKTCCRSSSSGWAPSRRGLACLGTSMGGQGALRLAYKFPQLFPVVAAISPAIDFHKRYNEGDETIPQMYPDPEAARQDTAILHIHPLNWPRHQFFCCDPEDYRWWESADRLRMKLWSLGVPHAVRPGNHRRRPRLRVLQPHGRAGDRLFGRQTRRRTAADRLEWRFEVQGFKVQGPKSMRASTCAESHRAYFADLRCLCGQSCSAAMIAAARLHRSARSSPPSAWPATATIPRS